MKRRADGQPVKVLVVDDSRSQRELLVALLAREQGFEVVGTAVNGRDAVDATLRLRPNVVAMDIHLPVIDGYEATRMIMQRCPTPIVLVSSSAGDAARRSIQALAAGALAVLPKPGSLGREHDQEQHALLTALRLMADVPVVTQHTPRPPLPRPGANGQRALPQVLAIAASTGGPAAVQTVLSGLGSSFPLPVLVAQHISRGFAGALAEWLNHMLALTVKIAQPDERLLPGHVYLAPDDQHLLVRMPGFAAAQAASPGDRYCPSADVLFESVAKVYGSRAIGIVLTGMGDDGAIGLKALRAAGALTLAQDEASCVVYGMPQAAARGGAVVRTEPLASMGEAVLQRLGVTRDG